MSKQLLYLIRHGSTQYPYDRSGRKLVYGPMAKLTDMGIMKTERFARSILNQEGSALEVLVTSPLRAQNKRRSFLVMRSILKSSRKTIFCEIPILHGKVPYSKIL